MRALCVLLLALLSPCWAALASMQPKCQRWCLMQEWNRVFLECCSFVEKAGACPSSEVQTFDHALDLRELHCRGDLDCPEGFKCCDEANYELYGLCKPIVLDRNSVEITEEPASESSGGRDNDTDDSGSGGDGSGLDMDGDDNVLPDVSGSGNLEDAESSGDSSGANSLQQEDDSREFWFE